ncbi:sialidase family protein [Candidatus Nitrosocosmicus sp. R]
MYSIYVQFEFTNSLFAFELNTAIFNNGNKTNTFESGLIFNKSNYGANDRNESQINYLINISSNNGHSELAKFAVAGKNISVIWLDDSSGYRDVHFKRSIDGGKTFEKTMNLGNIPGGAYDHQIAVINNYVFVIWEQSPDNNGQIFFKRSIDGGKTFEKTMNLGNNTGLSGTPQILVSKGNSVENGGNSLHVYIIWHDSSEGIVLRKSDDGGNTFGKALSLSENNPFAFFPKIATKGNNIYAIWITIYNKGTENETRDVSFAKSIDRGNSFGNVVNLTNNAKISFNAQLASSGNNVYVLWTNGTIVKDDFPILTDTMFKYSNNSGQTFQDTISLNNYTGWSVNPMIKIKDDKLYILWEERSQNRYSDIYFCVINIKDINECNYKINVSNDSNNSFNPSFDILNNSALIAWTNEDSNYTSSIIIKKNINPLNNFTEIETSLMENNTYYLNPQVVFSDLGNEAFIIWNGDSDINDEIYLTNIDYANIDDGKNEVNNKNVVTKMNTTLTYNLDNYFPLSNIDIEYPNNSTSLNTTHGIRIALVDPTFTNAAYDNSFYIFYNLYNNFSFYQTTTKYINLLESKIDKDSIPDYTELYLQNHISNLMPSANVTIISDLDVHNRNIFNDNTITSNKYDVIILGHQEYVTQKEYDYLRQFVANGGILILPYSNILYAEVNYNPKDNTVVLVKGHSWDFDGKSATKSIIAERWINETSEWVGSNYANQSSGIIFGNNPFGYLKHEEQFITNPKVKVLLDYNVTLPTINPKDFHDFRIAAYEHNYKEGKVIQLGIYPSDDLLNNDRFNRFFDSILLKYIN